MRLEWDKYFMEMAILSSKRSTCLRRQVGAVIVKDNRVLATGYNGSPVKMDNCIDTGKCLRKELNIPSGERHELCYAVHAEANAIIQCAVHGVSCKGATIYVTASPCSMCLKQLINAGIKHIVALEYYPDELSKELIDKSDITIKMLEMTNIKINKTKEEFNCECKQHKKPSKKPSDKISYYIDKYANVDIEITEVDDNINELSTEVICEGKHLNLKYKEITNKGYKDGIISVDKALAIFSAINKCLVGRTGKLSLKSPDFRTHRITTIGDFVYLPNEIPPDRVSSYANIFMLDMVLYNLIKRPDCSDVLLMRAVQFNFRESRPTIVMWYDNKNYYKLEIPYSKELVIAKLHNKNEIEKPQLMIPDEVYRVGRYIAIIKDYLLVIMEYCNYDKDVKFNEHSLWDKEHKIDQLKIVGSRYWQYYDHYEHTLPIVFDDNGELKKKLDTENIQDLPIFDLLFCKVNADVDMAKLYRK